MLQLCRARGHVERAGDKLTGFHGVQQGIQAAGGVERLQHKLERAAAGQAEAVGLFGADAVFDGLGLDLLQAFAAHTVDQVVFNAAARYRADDDTIVAQREHGAFGPGR